jgi:gliding motility-associated-like protein
MCSEFILIAMKVFYIFCLLFLFILSSEQCLFSQESRLEVVGTTGMYVSSQYGSMAWTIGEVSIDTYSNSNNFFTQGFHQPERKEKNIISDFFIPEGFSPNNDGINDLFVLRGIENYPINSIKIFNRWGTQVYDAIGYKNKWDGKSTMGFSIGGDELPVSTYFYLFDFGNGSKIQKGTIYLNR